jgi:hypothetical protein
LSGWAKANTVAVATWAGVALSLAVTGATHVALADDTQQGLVETVEGHDASIVRLESDLRSVRESQDRLVRVVERTESVLQELDRTTAALRALVGAREQ